MTALPSWQYRDPLEAAMRMEAQSCKGCVFERSATVFNERVMLCEKDKPHGTKCKLFNLNQFSIPAGAGLASIARDASTPVKQPA